MTAGWLGKLKHTVETALFFFLRHLMLLVFFVIKRFIKGECFQKVLICTQTLFVTDYYAVVYCSNQLDQIGL